MTMNYKVLVLGAACLSLWSEAHSAEAIPIDAFFEGSRIQDLAISPDGHYLSMIANVSGRRMVLVMDRVAKTKAKVVMAEEPGKRINPTWCGWANATRLLCGFRGVADEMGQFYPVSRLVGVNADGTQLKVLNLSSRPSSYEEETNAQFQDQVIDWTPDDPDTVLMSLDEDRDTFPAVVAVNVYTGGRHVVVRQHAPIRAFATDGNGHVRLGWGFQDTKIFYFAKLAGESDWLRLAKVEAFSNEEGDAFKPVAAIPGSNLVYASKQSNGREALWQIDLKDEHVPEVLFEHPTVDIGSFLFSPTKQLLGVAYETDRPKIYYSDPKRKAYVDALDTVLPNRFNSLIDKTRDERLFVVRSTSDVIPPEYYLLDTANNTLALERIGSSNPGITTQRLAPMRAINYAAKDGTVIPGYLTVPLGMRAENLPLIVMPHGGPIARDSWGFDPWVQLLASRGYAVLQMNFRGSDGYGSEWYWAAHQDWGGLTYSDITDGTRWAIAQGIADPKRVCIVGASFGGYAALLGATRDSALYRCAVSISGVSDLPEMLADDQHFTNGKIARRQVGTDSAKLKVDSPRRHVEKVNIPVLMIHGDHDYTVNFDQTKMMASALKSAGKQYKVVKIEGADHYYSEDSDARTLFTELETFLNSNLGGAAK
jgi:dipeptidyl aminopeptidase/acylaminoacyl peptidase